MHAKTNTIHDVERTRVASSFNPISPQTHKSDVNALQLLKTCAPRGCKDTRMTPLISTRPQSRHARQAKSCTHRPTLDNLRPGPINWLATNPKKRVIRTTRAIRRGFIYRRTSDLATTALFPRCVIIFLHWDIGTAKMVSYFSLIAINQSISPICRIGDISRAN